MTLNDKNIKLLVRWETEILYKKDTFSVQDIVEYNLFENDFSISKLEVRESLNKMVKMGLLTKIKRGIFKSNY